MKGINIHLIVIYVLIGALFFLVIKNSFDKVEVECNEISGVLYGIDVSHHQGQISWSKVNNWEGQPIQFVYVKATEGATYQDPDYNRNIEGAQGQKIPIGSYHYFRTSSDPNDQLSNFFNTARKESQDLIPLVDVEEMKEWNKETFHRNLKYFLEEVEKHYGAKPMIYTVNSFYNHHLSGKYQDYKFLIGRYGKNTPNMRDDHDWFIWQFSETGNVDGIPKPVDIDRINSKFTLEELRLK